jgi:outer membrane protein assembly factor BamB
VHRGLSTLGELVCLETATGKKLRNVNLKRDLGGAVLHDGRYTESPLVDEDALVCSPGGSRGTVAALDKKTGQVLWRSKGLTDEAVSSSNIVAHNPVEQRGKERVGIIPSPCGLDASEGGAPGWRRLACFCRSRL